jgi:hypothetical protein
LTLTSRQIVPYFSKLQQDLDKARNLHNEATAADLQEQVQAEEEAVYESRRKVVFGSSMLLMHVPSKLYVTVTGEQAMAHGALRMTVGPRCKLAAFTLLPGLHLFGIYVQHD